MAILDTLITQLTQGKFSLTQTASQARNNVTGKEQNTEKLHSFRQDAMGAISLFTGGHSLNGLHHHKTHHMGKALDRLIHHLSAPPRNITPPLSAHQLQPLPTANLGATQAQDIADPSQQPLHKAIFVTPSPTRSPSDKSARHILHAQQDWKALLAKSNGTMQRALREVEPNVHNLQQAFTALAQARPHNAPSSPVPPLPALQCLSALTTARGILAATSPHLAHGPTVPHRASATQFAVSSPRSIPPAPAWAHAIPSSPAPPPIHQTIRHHMRQLGHIIYRATSSPSETIPHAPSNLHTAPSLMALTQQLEAAAPSRQTATHHTTTHSPNVHITVNAAQASPDDLAHMIEESAVKSLTRHTLFRTG